MVISYICCGDEDTMTWKTVRITGPLRVEYTGHELILLTNSQLCAALKLPFVVGWTKRRVMGGFRRHDAHVTSLMCWCWRWWNGRNWKRRVWCTISSRPDWNDWYFKTWGSWAFHSLQWRHNGRYGVSNHQPPDCSLKCLFEAQIKENIKAPRHWSLCWEFTGDRWIPRTKGQ